MTSATGAEQISRSNSVGTPALRHRPCRCSRGCCANTEPPRRYSAPGLPAAWAARSGRKQVVCLAAQRRRTGLLQGRRRRGELSKPDGASAVRGWVMRVRFEACGSSTGIRTYSSTGEPSLPALSPLECQIKKSAGFWQGTAARTGTDLTALAAWMSRPTQSYPAAQKSPKMPVAAHLRWPAGSGGGNWASGHQPGNAPRSPATGGNRALPSASVRFSTGPGRNRR